MSTPRTLLHVFSTFKIGGPQIRFAQLANHFASRYRHLVVSMDGAKEALQRLSPDLDVKLLSMEIARGRTLKNIPVFRRLLRQLKPDLLVTSNWGSIDWAIANTGGVVRHLHMEDGFGPEE